MANKHALLSPSGAAGWMNCPGKLAMEKRVMVGRIEVESPYALEGTAAHALAEHCLQSNTHPSTHIGVNLFDIDTEYPNWIVTSEMAGNVNIYVQQIKDYAEGNDLYVESRVDISKYTGEEEGAGTADAIIIDAKHKELQVDDLKYGMGVAVDPEENEQMLLYALGAYEELKDNEIENIRLVIHQPRIGKGAPKEWDCSLNDLLLFGEKVKKAAKTALAIYNMPDDTDLEDTLKPSEKACKFCKAVARCPARAKQVQKVLAMDFEDLTQPKLIVPMAQDKNLGRYLAAIPMIEAWCSAVRSEAYKTAVIDGQIVEGFKVVKGKKGNRKFSSEPTAKFTMDEFDVAEEDMYKKTLITASAAEEISKKYPGLWPQLIKLVTQDDGALQLVPNTDKRPAHIVKPLIDEFSVISEEEEGLA